MRRIRKKVKSQRGYPNYTFDFLGYSFRPRVAMNKKGSLFVGFLRAISNKASKLIRDEMRSWRIHNRTDKSLDDFSRMFNSQAARMGQLLCEVLQIRGKKI